MKKFVGFLFFKVANVFGWLYKKCIEVSHHFNDNNELLNLWNGGKPAAFSRVDDGGNLELVDDKKVKKLAKIWEGAPLSSDLNDEEFENDDMTMKIIDASSKEEMIQKVQEFKKSLVDKK